MVHPLGRQPIGVNQPPSGGSHYPFVLPSEDVQHLLGDFYLSFEDDRCEWVYPFHVVWLFGFGEEVVTPPEDWPTPTHAYDLVIHDALGTVVFDSTEAERFAAVDWPTTNPRLKILEWVTPSAVCRTTLHTQWTTEDTAAGLARPYDEYITPENGELDARTLNRLPRRVRSLTVGLTKLEGVAVEFEAGFNIAWSQADTTDVINELQLDLNNLGLEPLTGPRQAQPGIRAVQRIIIDAIPGAGLGVVPGCEETEPVVRNLGGATADLAGNVILDAEGCIKVQRPVSLVSTTPREFQYAHFDLDGVAARAALELGNDCKNCCDCDYFVRTYKGLSRQWDLWKAMAGETEDVRDLHQENIDRWNAERACREADPFKLILIPEAECKAAVGVSYCHVHDRCARPLALRFAFSWSRDGVEQTAGASCGAADVFGGTQKRADIPRGFGENYALAGAWPVYEAVFDYADPRDVSRVSFRVCLGGCTPEDQLRVWVSAHYPDFDGSPYGLPTPVPPAQLAEIWAASALGVPTLPTRYIKESKPVVVNPISGYCMKCDC